MTDLLAKTFSQNSSQNGKSNAEKYKLNFQLKKKKRKLQ